MIKTLFSKRAAMAVLPFSLAAVTALAQPVPGGSLDPLSIPKYAIPMVIPPVMNNTGTANDYDIAVRQFQQQILPGGVWDQLGGTNFGFPATTVWSYGPAADPLPANGIAPAGNSQFNYPAYTIETVKDTPVTVDWMNDLVDAAGNFLPHLLPVDQTLHWANPKAVCKTGEVRTDCHGTTADPYLGPVPIITHVHGTHGAPASDGYTEAWYLPAAANIICVPRNTDGSVSALPGPGEYVCEGSIANQFPGEAPNTNVTLGVGNFTYTNDQPSTTLWYHDHSLGLTRVNVYAGPAGFWLIRDGAPDAVSDETGLVFGNLPYPAPVAGQSITELSTHGTQGARTARDAIRETPVVIQDRSFNVDGSLFYPDNRAFFEGLNVAGTAGTADAQFPGAPELQINLEPDPTSDIAPIWNPEAFFNTMVVNGVVWPQLEVAPALYRFRLLNASNSRFLNLSLPVWDSSTNLQTTAVRTQWFREVSGDTGNYKGPFKSNKVSTNELFFWQIGTDQALLPKVTAIRTGFATEINFNPEGWAFETKPYFVENDYKISGETAAPSPEQALLLGPAERGDVIVDFRGLPNGTVIRMINTAPDAPFGGFPDVPADPSTSGQVMEFVVNTDLLGASAGDDQFNSRGRVVRPAATAATSPWNLVMGPVDGGTTPPADNTRELALVEEESTLVCADVDVDGNVIQLPEVPVAGVCPTATALPFAPKAAVLGTVDATGTPTVTLWSDPIATTNRLGDTEVWNLNNFTVDAHPIHVHQVKYQVKGRIGINGAPSIITTPGGVQAWEHGWKDTVIAYPGETTSIAATFDLPGLYVWHCHIVEHEDNEMMVPFCTAKDPANPGVDCPIQLF